MTTTLDVPATFTGHTPNRVEILPSQLPGNLCTPVAFDFETSSLWPDEGGIATASVAWFEDNIQDADHIRTAAFPFAQGEEGKPDWNGQGALFGDAREINLPLEEWQALTRWLASNQLIAHNAQFDLIMARGGVMKYRWDDGHGIDLVPHLYWDTMLANYVLWPREMLGLKETFDRLWPDEGGKDSQTRLKKHLKNQKKKRGDKGSVRYDLANWEVMEQYADDDAFKALRLYLVQKKAFVHPDNPQYHHYRTLLLEVIDLLVNEESRGMPYAVKASREVAQRVEEAKLKLGASLPFEPTGDHAKKYFYGDPDTVNRRGHKSLGLTPAYRSEKTGEPSLNSEALRELAEQGFPWAKEWQIYTLLDRAQSMYYNGWADKCGPDGRIRARTRQLGTVSTRFSIERANLQAMPHDRKLEGLAFVGLDNLPTPRTLIKQQVDDTMPGWMLMEYDLSQAELRLGALLSKCKKMLEAYFDGVDLHQFTADQVGAPRQVGKVANLSLEYGAGWRTLGDMMVKMTGGKVKMTPRELQAVHGGYHQAYPELNQAIERWDLFARRNKYVPLIGGQKRHIRFGEDTRLGWNQVVQGSLGQYMLHWLLDIEGIARRMGIHKRAKREGIGGAGLLMQVHDSAINLIPMDLEEEFSYLVKKSGVDLWRDFFGYINGGVPMKVDGKPFAEGE
jgi:DNA polymerase I-like protein with 3'-5' exonuclease and polymerase domains